MNSRNRYSSNPTFGIPKRSSGKKQQVPQSSTPNNSPPVNSSASPYNTYQAQNSNINPQMPYGQPVQPPFQPTNIYSQQGTYQQQGSYPPLQRPMQGAAPNQVQIPMGGSTPMQNQMPIQGAMPYAQHPPYQDYTVLPPQNEMPLPPHTNDLWVKILLIAILPLLFVATLVFSAMPLIKWVFIAFTVLGLLGMWFVSSFASSAKTTLSLVYVALLLVTIVMLFANPSVGGQPDATGTPAPNNPYNYDGSQVNNPSLGALIGNESIPTTEPTPTPAASTSEAAIKLEEFFYLWQDNNLASMLELCAPSWKASLTNEPRIALFTILQNRLPSDYAFESITGTDADSSRTIVCTATIDKRYGYEPVKYRFQVMMLREDNVWYIAPQSLSSNEQLLDATAEITNEYIDNALLADATATDSVADARPTVTPAPGEKTILYYNKSGGKRYHIDAECSSVDKSYLPLTQFYYGELNNKLFKSLTPCLVCNAPAR